MVTSDALRGTGGKSVLGGNGDDEGGGQLGCETPGGGDLGQPHTHGAGDLVACILHRHKQRRAKILQELKTSQLGCQHTKATIPEEAGKSSAKVKIN